MCNPPGNTRAQQISSLLRVPAPSFLSLVSACLKHEEHQDVEVWVRIALPLQRDFTPPPLFPHCPTKYKGSAVRWCYLSPWRHFSLGRISVSDRADSGYLQLGRCAAFGFMLVFSNTCKILTFSAKLSCSCYIHIVSP